jgi:sugar/nucleoside kinase (ribokinase family)
MPRGTTANELFRPGKLIETQGLSISLGGLVANTGLAMRRFDQRVKLMGSAGQDTLGDFIVSQLAREGEVDGVRRVRRAGTAYGIVLAPAGLDRIFLEDPGCSAHVRATDYDLGVIARSRLFHFGYPALMKHFWTNNGAECRKLFKRISRLGVVTSMDTSVPDFSSPAGRANWTKILANVLPWVDIFMPSIEEILFMLDPKQYARLLAGSGKKDPVDVIPDSIYRHLADRLLTMGVQIVMIKAGHRGAYIRTGDINRLGSSTGLELPVANWSGRELWAAPFPVDSKRFKNSCGAGDCAVAGFLTAILRSETIEKAARFAMLAGRDNLYGADALSGLSNWETMGRRVTRRR